MIVKIETNQGWAFYDGVKEFNWSFKNPGDTNLTTYYDIYAGQEPKEDETRSVMKYIMLCVENSTAWQLIHANGEIYLLNDNGKTIERI